MIAITRTARTSPTEQQRPLERRHASTAVVVLCTSGGQAVAAVLERI